MNAQMREFLEGLMLSEDKKRSGRLRDSFTDENAEAIGQLIEGNQRITIRQIEASFPANDCLKSTITRIIYERLQYRKLLCQWIPRVLTEEQNCVDFQPRSSSSPSMSNKGWDLLQRIVTGDETWVHHFTPTSKVASMEWCKPGEVRRKKARMERSAGKVMATVFWDAQEVLLVQYMERGTTINSETYCQVLTDLCKAIRKNVRDCCPKRFSFFMITHVRIPPIKQRSCWKNSVGTLSTTCHTPRTLL